MEVHQLIGIMTESEADKFASVLLDMRDRVGKILLDEPTQEHMSLYVEIRQLFDDANAQVVYEMCRVDAEDLEDSEDLPEWMVDMCNEHEERFAEPDGPFDEPDDDYDEYDDESIPF